MVRSGDTYRIAGDPRGPAGFRAAWDRAQRIGYGLESRVWFEGPGRVCMVSGSSYVLGMIELGLRALDGLEEVSE